MHPQGKCTLSICSSFLTAYTISYMQLNTSLLKCIDLHIKYATPGALLVAGTKLCSNLRVPMHARKKCKNSDKVYFFIIYASSQLNSIHPQNKRTTPIYSSFALAGRLGESEHHRITWCTRGGQSDSLHHGQNHDDGRRQEATCSRSWWPAIILHPRRQEAVDR